MDDPNASTPSIVDQTDDLLVIAKPSGWHTVRAGPVEKDAAPSVEHWLMSNHESSRHFPEAGLLHRLDYLTSGCLLAARDEDAYDRYRERFRAGANIDKEYLAVVERGLSPEQGAFDLYFTSRYRRSRKVTVRDTGKPKDRGRCHWTVLARRFAAGADLVLVRIIGPGRRHQIRAGFAHLGHPVLNDPLYGSDDVWERGFGLHAWRVRIDDQTFLVPPPARWDVPRELLE